MGSYGDIAGLLSGLALTAGLFTLAVLGVVEWARSAASSDDADRGE
jgi:hypothetical protein